MRTRFLLTAATMLVAPLAATAAWAQSAEAPVAPVAPTQIAPPAAPAAPPQIEMAPLPEIRLPEPRSFSSDTRDGFQRDMQEFQRNVQRQAREAGRAAREAAREAEREARDAEREGNDSLRDLGDRIREKVDRVIIAQAGPALPPLPPIPDIGRATVVHLKDVDKQLSPEDARRIVDGAIAFKGNKRLKVGKAEADGSDWAKVEVRTVDDSLVDTVRVNRKTGMMERTP